MSEKPRKERHEAHTYNVRHVVLIRNHCFRGRDKSRPRNGRFDKGWVFIVDVWFGVFGWVFELVFGHGMLTWIINGLF